MLTLLLYVEINTFALAVLFLIFLNVYHKSEKYLFEQKLFLTLIISNSLILIFDSAMWILDGKTGISIRVIYLLVTAIYYTLNPVICMLWSFYADFLIYRDQSRFRKLLIPLSLPAFINAILSFISIFTDSMFYIDENNIYHRGSFFFLMAVISYFYLTYTFIKIIVKRHKIPKRNFIPILIFAIPPFIGGLLQSFFYGVSLIWICVTLSILTIFINIQNDQLYTDHLTGLYNRRHLDYYLRQRIQNKNCNRLFAGIMIDIDSFKMINDLYGHSVGDQALENTANILKKTFTKNDFIARYGGDEFVVIAETKDKLTLNHTLDKLSYNIRRFNEQNTALYKISLSMGYDFFDSNIETSVEKFLNNIDGLMYENKAKKQLRD